MIKTPIHLVKRPINLVKTPINLVWASGMTCSECGPKFHPSNSTDEVIPTVVLTMARDRPMASV